MRLIRNFLLIWTIKIFCQANLFRNLVKIEKTYKKISNMLIKQNLYNCIFLQQNVLGIMHLLSTKILLKLAFCLSILAETKRASRRKKVSFSMITKWPRFLNNTKTLGKEGDLKMLFHKCSFPKALGSKENSLRRDISYFWTSKNLFLT